MGKSAIIFALTCLIISCEKGSDSSPDLVRDTLISGTWRITMFTGSSASTGDFAAYTFTFSSDRTVTAVNGGVYVSGTWGSSYGSVSGYTVANLTLQFSSPLVFTNLNGTWNVSGRFDDEIDAGGGTTFFQFKKN